MLKHILFTLGTRPEAIKLSPLIQVCKQEPSFKVTVLSTGQHDSMLYQGLAPFHVEVDRNLKLMRPNQNLNSFISEALNVLGKEYETIHPDVVFVQGDTSTVLAAAMAAFYLKIPVAHVEAGLRTHDYKNPFPEEANRRLTDHLSSFHFCPTSLSKSNLKRENIPSDHIFISGNTIVDALEWLKNKDHCSLPQKLTSLSRDTPVILVTLHRRENHGIYLKNICRELLDFIETNPNIYLYFPVHLNPMVRETVFSMLQHPRIILDEPADYYDLLGAIQRSTLIVTDSGGIQEEAPSFNKYVVVLRKKTERPESIERGISTLFDPEDKGLAQFLNKCLKSNIHEGTFISPYGDGKASQRIKDYLLWEWGLKKLKPVEFKSE